VLVAKHLLFYLTRELVWLSALQLHRKPEVPGIGTLWGTHLARERGEKRDPNLCTQIERLRNQKPKRKQRVQLYRSLLGR